MSADVATPTGPAEGRRPYLRSNGDQADEAARSKVEATMLNAVRPMLRSAGQDSAEADSDASPALIAFSDLGKELDRRSRESASMVRLLEQHRRQLAKAEKDRNHAADMLARVIPVVEDTGRKLKIGMESFRPGEDPAQLQTLFTMNARALDELERVAEDLNASAAWNRTCWEQYIASVETAQQMRSS